MSPELVAILALGITLIGLLISFRRDTRADNQALRAEIRADLADVQTNLADLRKDVQALTQRVSRLEGVIEGLFARRDCHDDAA